VLNWTVALNEELRGTRARALAVSPGTTSTPFFATAGIGSQATASALTLTPDDVAVAALRALASGRAHVVTGWGNKVYTWLGARLPKAWAARLAAGVMRKRRKQRPAA
jgi:short-subunit dehydrogenase